MFFFCGEFRLPISVTTGAVMCFEIHSILSHLFVTRSLLLVPTSNLRYLYEVVPHLVVLNHVLFDVFGYLPMSLCDWCK